MLKSCAKFLPRRGLGGNRTELISLGAGAGVGACGVWIDSRYKFDDGNIFFIYFCVGRLVSY